MRIDQWELQGLGVGAGDPAALTRDAGDAWIPAIVPGGVHESLMAAGLLDDPRVGARVATARWIEERDWWYRARFTVDDGRGAYRLVCDGLDTIAELWLDGRPLGTHRNQFRPAVFELADGLEAGEHVLLVRLSPPLPDVPAARENGLAGAARVAAGVRKASFSWGWDFAPRLASIGVAAPVRLDPVSARLGHPRLTTALTPDRAHARVAVGVDVETADAAASTVSFALESPTGRAFTAEAGIVDGTAGAVLAVDDPELWWTHDLGDPALHRLRIELRDGDRVIDIREQRVGLRTIELDRSPVPVEGGRLFRFVLNGVPLFVRGANWVPPSPFVGSIDADLRRDLVHRAREGGLSMLRVWGGGIYEHDAFYDACDELGVLVWQDFMFACIAYPGDDAAFVDEVRAEARHQVARLRSRASLALWCGNNEVEALDAIRVADGGEPREWGRAIFEDVLPAIVAELDGAVPYWPGSPWGVEVNGFRDGDRHAWEVWHGRTGAPYFTGEAGGFTTPGDARHWRRFADDTGRFISEFGILSAPGPETFERWMSGAELHDDVFDAHLTDRPATKVEELLAVTTGEPTDLDEYIAFTQAAQAEAVLFAVEHFRRRQPHTAGVLVWQFGDSWPAMSWSIVDVDGRPKPAYFALSRASSPLAVSIAATPDDGVEVWLANNTLVHHEVELDIEIATFDGVEHRTQRVSAAVASGESRPVWSGRVRHDSGRFVWASSPDDAFPPARLYFGELGALPLTEPGLEVTPDGDVLEIRSRGHAYGVRISHPDPRVRLSDNHFDLRDRERRRIRVHGADARTLTVTSTVPHARVRSGEDS